METVFQAAKIYLGRVYTPLSTGGWVDYRDGAFVVGADGRIADIGDRKEILDHHPKVEIEDYRGKLILPGFVDCHQHICHYEWAQHMPDLMEWLDHIYKLEVRFEDTRAFNELCQAPNIVTPIVISPGNECQVVRE